MSKAFAHTMAQPGVQFKRKPNSDADDEFLVHTRFQTHRTRTVLYQSRSWMSWIDHLKEHHFPFHQSSMEHVSAHVQAITM